MVRSAMGDLSGALSDFDAALRLHPDDLETTLSRGLTLSKLGDTTEALASYEQAMQLAPGDPRPYHNRGRFIAAALVEILVEVRQAN